MNGTTLYMMLPDEGDVAEVQPVTSSGDGVVTCGVCGKAKLYLAPDPLKVPPAPDAATRAVMEEHCVIPLGDKGLWPPELFHSH